MDIGTIGAYAAIAAAIIGAVALVRNIIRDRPKLKVGVSVQNRMMLLVVLDRTNKNPSIEQDFIQFESKNGARIGSRTENVRLSRSNKVNTVTLQVQAGELRRNMEKLRVKPSDLKYILVRERESNQYYKGKIKRSARRFLEGIKIS